MLYITINTRHVKRVGIVFFALVLLGLLFCLWAIGVSGSTENTEPPTSHSDTAASVRIFTVVSASEAYSDSLNTAEDDGHALPAYVSLQPYTLSRNIALPLDSAYISSKFGFRDHPINGKYSFHSGLDLAAAEGSPIYAVLDGTVIRAEYASDYGYHAVIEHENGFSTLYAHCLSLNVEVGDTVAKGQQIALVGSTGSATGPHLHIEFRCNGQRYDPYYALGASYT